MKASEMKCNRKEQTNAQVQNGVWLAKLKY